MPLNQLFALTTALQKKILKKKNKNKRKDKKEQNNKKTKSQHENSLFGEGAKFGLLVECTVRVLEKGPGFRGRPSLQPRGRVWPGAQSVCKL